MDRLAIALARTARANDMTAVLFCDLDAFKVVNDSVGHEGGDRVLIEVARRFKASAPRSPTPSRGPAATSSSSCARDSAASRMPRRLVARIRDIVETPIAFDDFEAAVSVSIGIVTVAGFEASTVDPLVLLRNADAAMYRAKRGGKARWALFDESAATHRLELEPSYAKRSQPTSSSFTINRSST